MLTSPDGPPSRYVHLKDVLDLTNPGAIDQPIPPNRIRELPTVQRADELEDALAAIRSQRAHVARVVEGEAVTGVLFLEDIVEELIGEVQDATGA